jgi:hypothetical protein
VIKWCIYCKSENRAEAIFCQNCRRPLPYTPRPPRIAFVWLLGVVALIGFGTFLFSPRLFVAPTATQRPATTSSGLPVDEPSPTQRLEPVTILACVETSTNIRRGPGTHSETIGGLPAGSCLTIVGRNEEASWVYMISDDDLTGWIATTVLADIGDIRRVSVRDSLALVDPARPTLTSEEIAHGARVYLTRISATNHPQSPLNQYVEPCFETVNRVGDRITCRMEKAYCNYFPEEPGSPTACVDRPAPDHVFALVAFDRDWSDLDGQCLIITGYLEVDGGLLRIQAHDRDQVTICQ